MTTLNIDTKSQLAKLLATENITVQQNNVKTASFDVVSRVLTLPIFKTDSKDVTDMLIAHECAHALFTPEDGWKKHSADETLRSYINVLEDCRIDLLVQKKYPGVIKNYMNGFDILNKRNFFGLKDRNINTDLMLIDKINLRSKSLQRLPLQFDKDENKWLAKVDKLKTFNDVVKLAKQMLDWQKDKVEQLKKLPDFDDHIIVKNYNLNGKHDDEVIEVDNDFSDVENEENKESDKQEAGEGNTESESDKEKPAVGDKTKKDDENKDSNKSGGAVGAGGDQPLKSITNNYFEAQRDKLRDTSVTYAYKGLPDADLNKVIISNKQFIKDMKKSFARDIETSKRYLPYLKDHYNKFLKDSKKTIMYLVKEFELKKAATAYKRSTTDKTGIIDSLKLKDYKFSDDIFKRLTILPEAKNHGMIMLLDWSGSMSDCIFKTVQQLIQLVYFCQKVNIPYDVYFFTSEYDTEARRLESADFNYKIGDMVLETMKLVNVASSNLKKMQLDESMMYLYHCGKYYEDRYCSYRDYDYSTPDTPCLPTNYYLGSTPLNEALIAMLKIIPAFKNKHKVEKMNFITLTDGGSNYSGNNVKSYDKESKTVISKHVDCSHESIFTYKKKQYKAKKSHWSYERTTTCLLDIIKKLTNSKVIGFYLIKRIRRWDTERYLRPEDDRMSYEQKNKVYEKNRLAFTKDKVCAVKQHGYDEYYVVNAKDMKVQNVDLENINDTMKAGKIKSLFSKSMKGRLTSRVLLNKFIQQVA